MFSEEEADVEEVFVEQAQELAEEARFLAGAPCDRLATAVEEQPAMIGELRGFAALLRRVAAQDQVLERFRTQSILKQMDDELDQLRRALAACGIEA